MTYNPSLYTSAQHSEHGIRSGIVRRAKVKFRDQRIVDLKHSLDLSCREIALELLRRGIAKVSKSMVNIVLRRAGIGFPLRSRRQHRWITHKRPVPVSNKPSRSQPPIPDHTSSGGSGSSQPPVRGSGSSSGVGVRWTPLVPRSEWQPEMDELKARSRRERLAYDLGWRKNGGIWTRIDS